MSSFHTKISGVTFDNENGTSRQDLIEDLAEAVEVDDAARALTLVRDRRNRFDANAVAVMDHKGRQLGFLSRDVAASLAPALDAGRRFTVRVSQVTGGGLTHAYGVNIHVHG